VVDPTDRRRARHVVTENARVLAAAEAMRSDDATELGRLMRESHVSLRDDFEVSSPALDAIVAVADRAPGCLGARMTGGGFAGCAVALVDAARAAEFADHVVARYRHDGHLARVWRCEPAAGAGIIAA
jgi:galactokinase